MNPRRIYYRKKGKTVIIEGKSKGKTVYIYTLPKDIVNFLRFLAKASFFTKDKANGIFKNIQRLDYKVGREPDEG